MAVAAGIMTTRVLDVRALVDDDATPAARAAAQRAVEEAVAHLRAGELVALPTETVYGLGARALDPIALARIFAAKGRPTSHPLIAHVLDVHGAERVALDVGRARPLLDAFWPGPLTVVLPRRADAPAALSGGLDTVAVRAPAHPVARALIAALGEPIAAPSANRYQHVSPTEAAHVVRSLGDAVGLVLDGGPTTRGIESTVVELIGAPRLLRPGPIDVEMLRRLLPELTDAVQTIAESEARRAPGMDARHYAPTVPTRVFSSPVWRAGEGAVLCGDGLRHLAQREGVDAIVLPNDPVQYAAKLYAALHTLEARASAIHIQAVPDGEAWRAVRDRITRAAGSA